MRATICGSTVLTLLILLLSGQAFADEKKEKEKWRADAGRGLKLANGFCTSCHLVSSGQTGAAVVGVPSFRAIANMDGRTDAFITNVLIRPHPPMPDARLTAHEIGDLLAYFATLRKDGAGKLPRPDNTQGRPNPPYPSAS